MPMLFAPRVQRFRDTFAVVHGLDFASRGHSKVNKEAAGAEAPAATIRSQMRQRSTHRSPLVRALADAKERDKTIEPPVLRNLPSRHPCTHLHARHQGPMGGPCLKGKPTRRRPLGLHLFLESTQCHGFADARHTAPSPYLRDDGERNEPIGVVVRLEVGGFRKGEWGSSVAAWPDCCDFCGDHLDFLLGVTNRTTWCSH